MKIRVIYIGKPDKKSGYIPGKKYSLNFSMREGAKPVIEVSLAKEGYITNTIKRYNHLNKFAKDWALI